MASLTECDAALQTLAARFSTLPSDVRAKYIVERTVSCRVPDLGVTWWGRLSEEGLAEITTTEDKRAQVRLTVSSDDLVALLEGRIGVQKAVATGKVRVQASPFDLLRLSAFL